MSLRRLIVAWLLAVLVPAACLFGGLGTAFAQAPFYNGYTAYPFSYPYGYYPTGLSTTPVSMTPITTTNPLGSTTFIPAPIAQQVPVSIPQTSVAVGGSYCNVGDEQIYVPAGASPSDYGCSTTPPASSAPSS